MKAFWQRIFLGGVTSNSMLLLAIVIMVVAGNRSYFGQILAVYGFGSTNGLVMASLPLTLGAATALMLGLVVFGRLTKPILVTMLLITAVSAYFMDSFSTIINDEMLLNVAQTNIGEAADLINLRLIAYVCILGLLPAAIVIMIPVRWRGWRREILARIVLIAISVGILVGSVLGSNGFYASFVREHKVIRSYANPTYPVYSAIKFASAQLSAGAVATVTPLGADARRAATATHRKLIIVVVGETARSDRFSLNGYQRETNPRLSKEKVISFTEFTSCGTSTASSVPCMFSRLGREAFSISAAAKQENVLDVIQRAGAHVLWLDNNSDSKGVALRVPYENYREAAKNPVCDEECRDVGMLANLQKFIDGQATGDIVVVLHQMGNHGPAYFKRYPKEFERFTPACQNNDLSQCSIPEINNAYDNAILYTDHFLAEIIALLKKNDARFATGMFYMSDHGESLGEDGVFLHGLPYFIAPRAQILVPAVMWLGAKFSPAQRQAVTEKQDVPLSHDNLFDTLLGLLDIETAVYQPELDILRATRKPGR